MKTNNKVYLYNLVPKYYTSGLTLCFNTRPTNEQVIEYILKLIERTKNSEFKGLCLKCMQAINVWNIPKQQGVKEWCDAGVSDYSSKGKTFFKILDVITAI